MGRHANVYPPRARLGIKLIRSRPGLVRELAEHLRISTSAIYAWQVIPPERVLEIEAYADIPRAKLRPDMYA